MSKYKSLGSYILFDNGYKVFFEPGGISPYCLFVHVWAGGGRVTVDQFLPDLAGGFFKADDFAKLLYRVSLAVPVPELEVGNE